MGAAVAYIRSAGVVRNSGEYRISGQNCVVSSRHHWHPSSEYEGQRYAHRMRGLCALERAAYHRERDE